MQKLLLYFVALFVFFFACTNDQQSAENVTKPANKEAATNPNEGPVTPQPITTPQQPPAEYKHVAQAPKEDLKYPKEYNDLGVSMFRGAAIQNNILLENLQGKFGRRIKLSCSASYDDVLKFYSDNLEKNGWVKNPKMNKVHEDEDVRFYATNYTKDNYTLMHSVTDLGTNKTSVIQILKEN